MQRLVVAVSMLAAALTFTSRDADAAAEFIGTASFDVTVTAGGAPATARVRVWSGLPFGGVVQSAVVGVDGTVSLPVLNDGEYFLEIQSQTFGYASEFYPDSVFRADAQRFTITGEQHVAVAVTLEAAASIAGIITMPDGSPGDSTTVGATPVGPSDSQVITPATCNRPLPDDPPGTFRVACLHPSVDWVLKGFGLDRADNGYYPDSQSAFNATPIAVDPGQAVTGLTWQLRPKSPNVTLSRVSHQYFIAGTTTPGVRVFGANFPTDPHAITIRVDSSAFVLPTVDITVTSVLSSSELVATITVQQAEIGAAPISKALSVSTSIGGAFDSTVTLQFGGPTTPVASAAGRVVDAAGRSVAGVPVVVRSTAAPDVFGIVPQFSTVTGGDGNWTVQGIAVGSYHVHFSGTPALKPLWWPQKGRQVDAAVVALANGEARTGLDATLTRREPVRCSAAPRSAGSRPCRSIRSTSAAPPLGAAAVASPAAATALPGAWARSGLTTATAQRGTWGWRR